jgi:hypothetical protein
MTTSQVTCRCSAIYERTEFNAAPRETYGFDCTVCAKTLELFTATKAPNYRLISGPARMPETPSK